MKSTSSETKFELNLHRRLIFKFSPACVCILILVVFPKEKRTKLYFQQLYIPTQIYFHLPSSFNGQGIAIGLVCLEFRTVNISLHSNSPKLTILKKKICSLLQELLNFVEKKTNHLCGNLTLAANLYTFLFCGTKKKSIPHKK